MFKFWRIEKRRRAIVMWGNMASRSFLRVNPQHGPFRPVDTYECSNDSDTEPTTSMAPAASDIPTAGAGLPSQPVPELIELWMSSMHQALLDKSFRPTSTPTTLVLEIWRN